MMRTVKLISVLLTLALMLSFITACGIFAPENIGADYPEGSIAIDKYNIHLFYEIETYAECAYNHERGVTEAVAYVILTPLVKLRDAAGKVTVDITTKVYRSIDGREWKISNSEQTLLLKHNNVNESYKLTIQESYSARDPWRVNNKTVGVTINSAYGYVIPDALAD